MLEQEGLRSVLLGEAQSDFFNRRIAQESDVEYSGPMEWKDIISGVNQCDVVVSTAGEVLEMAVALGREAVLLQDKRDSGTDVSYLRGRGSIVEPFKLSGDKGTLSELLPDKVVESVLSRIDHLTSRSELHTVVESSHSDQADMSIVRSRVAAGRRKPKTK